MYEFSPVSPRVARIRKRYREGKEKLISLVQTYFDLDGMELQFNIIDAETLRDAQLHPDDHRDLVARIAGFSSYFIELHKDMQDDVIRRTELELT